MIYLDQKFLFYINHLIIQKVRGGWRKSAHPSRTRYYTSWSAGTLWFLPSTTVAESLWKAHNSCSSPVSGPSRLKWAVRQSQIVPNNDDHYERLLKRTIWFAVAKGKIMLVTTWPWPRGATVRYSFQFPEESVSRDCWPFGLLYISVSGFLVNKIREQNFKYY